MAKPERAYILFAVFATLYIILSFFLQSETEVLSRYNLTSDQARNLRLAVILPYVVIWFFAFFGFVRLKKYAQFIRKSEDGKSLSIIANGLFVLAIGLALSAITGRLLSYVGNTYPHLIPASTIARTYIDIIIGVVSMTLLYRGSQRLVSITKDNVKTMPTYPVMLGLSALGVSYAYLTLTNPARQFPTGMVDRAAYYLPDFLLLTTVVIPFIVVWYMGLHAAYYIYVYRKNVKGAIYRKALGYFASGIVFVILSRIALRYLTSLNTLAETWALGYLLMFIYCLLIIIGFGYGLIAIGAHKLKKIEDV